MACGLGVFRHRVLHQSASQQLDELVASDGPEIGRRRVHGTGGAF